MIESLSLARAQASMPERPAHIRTVPRLPRRRRRASLLRRLVAWVARRPADQGECCA